MSWLQVGTRASSWFGLLGEQIIEKQQSAKWGDGFLKQMSDDLLVDFPDVKGFSVRNLQRIRRWYLFLVWYARNWETGCFLNCATACGANTVGP